MKKMILLLLVFISNAIYAQQLPVVFLPAGHTLHFVSPEPIRYVDISSKSLEGDLPIKNVFRIRLKDTARNFREAIITIAGEKFIAQYHLMRSEKIGPSEIEIMPGDTRPLDIAGIGFSQNQLKRIALDLFARKPAKHIEKVNVFGVKGNVNHLYTTGEYIFLDLSYRNRTNLKYDIDAFTFSIDDRKVTKASNVQSEQVKPVFVLFPVPSFERNYRNIFVFKKMTFPGNKVFHIELREQQLSGRIIPMGITYKDVLGADTLPF